MGPGGQRTTSGLEEDGAVIRCFVGRCDERLNALISPDCSQIHLIYPPFHHAVGG